MAETEIKLGHLVKDIVTGFEGIAVARLESIDGTISYGIKAGYSKNDGKVPPTEYIDLGQLEYIGGGITVKDYPRNIGFTQHE